MTVVVDKATRLTFGAFHQLNSFNETLSKQFYFDSNPKLTKTGKTRSKGAVATKGPDKTGQRYKRKKKKRYRDHSDEDD